MRALIIGAGIAGLTAALRLRRLGFEVVVVERSRGPRAEGYLIDFFGPGYAVAERLGLLPELKAIHIQVPSFTFLRPDGEPRFALDYAELKHLLRDRHFDFLRGDLERVLYEHVRGDVTFCFGAELQSLRDDGKGVSVTLSDGQVQSADVVIGADGVHSRTRDLLFGDGARFERFLGYHAAAFIVDDPSVVGLRPDAFYTLTEPGRQITVYPLGGGRLATLFVHRASAPAERATKDDPRAHLRDVYGTMDWVAPKLLDSLDRVPAIYYDDASQVVLPRWWRGRTVLVGDACQCVSLLAGQGASMAMAGAHVLAEALVRHGPHVERAFADYESRIRPLAEAKQAGGRRMAAWFVPRTRLGITVRDAATRALMWPGFAAVARRWLAADDALPE